MTERLKRKEPCNNLVISPGHARPETDKMTVKIISGSCLTFGGLDNPNRPQSMHLIQAYS